MPRRLRGDADRRNWWCALAAAMGPTPLRRDRIRAAVAYCHTVLVEKCGCRDRDDLRHLRRGNLLAALATLRPGPRRLARIAVNRFLSEVAFRDEPPVLRAALRVGEREAQRVTSDVLPPPDPQHPAMAALARRHCRDHFDETEVARLLALERLSQRERLMIRIMAEAGLRRRAVAWLTVDGVYDRAADRPRPVGRALIFSRASFAAPGGRKHPSP